MRRVPALVLTTVLLSGCSGFPQLDDAVSTAARNADFPALLPIDQVISGAHDVQINETTVASLKGRVANLRSRAARLRGPVIDRKTRNRMRRAIRRHR